MKDGRPQFSFFANLYVLLFVALMLGAPLLSTAILAKHHQLAASTWITAGAASLGIAAIFGYANLRCSSDRLSYREGLLYVAASMMTGWTYLSLIFVLPALFITFLASLALSLYATLPGTSVIPAQSFHRLVAVFYRHRMRQ